jgi:hypothetical protein
MTKFMNRLDLQIRLHLAVRNLLAIIIYYFGQIPIHSKLDEWHKLTWEEFLEKLKSAGVSLKNEVDKNHLRWTFEEQKKQVQFIERELIRHDEILSNNKSII